TLRPSWTSWSRAREKAYLPPRYTDTLSGRLSCCLRSVITLPTRLYRHVPHILVFACSLDNLIFDFLKHFRVIFQILFGGFAPLGDFLVFIVEPSAGFSDYPVHGGQIQHVAGNRNSLVVH